MNLRGKRTTVARNRHQWSELTDAANLYEVFVILYQETSPIID